MSLGWSIFKMLVIFNLSLYALQLVTGHNVITYNAAYVSTGTYGTLPGCSGDIINCKQIQLGTVDYAKYIFGDWIGGLFTISKLVLLAPFGVIDVFSSIGISTNPLSENFNPAALIVFMTALIAEIELIAQFLSNRNFKQM